MKIQLDGNEIAQACYEYIARRDFPGEDVTFSGVSFIADPVDRSHKGFAAIVVVKKREKVEDGS